MHFALVTVAVCALGVTGCSGGREAEQGGVATVLHVVDGDTIDVQIAGRSERVRLIGIDTPETKRPDTPIECYGPEASAFTASLLQVGATVRIERDVVGRDDYGRLLGYVHLVGKATPGNTTPGNATPGNTSPGNTSPTNDVFVNMEIIERGFARPLTIEPNSTFAREFAAAARRAERSDLGLWATCSS